MLLAPAFFGVKTHSLTVSPTQIAALVKARLETD
jgi:hypothetical protein